MSRYATCMFLWLFMWSGDVAATSQAAMAFSTFNPCLGNASFCGTRILASGVIEADSYIKLASFIATSKDVPPVPTIVFDSPGGSVSGALAMGRLIRSRGYDTALEKDYQEEPLFKDGMRDIALNTVCASACSLAFLGGKNRLVDRDARYGVHQFYSKDRGAGEAAAQVTMTALALYLEEMGVSRRLLDLSSVVAPEGMRWLTSDEMRALRVDNSEPELSAWRIDADDTGAPILTVKQQVNADRELFLSLSNTKGGALIVVVVSITRNESGEDRTHMFPVGEHLDVSFKNSEWQMIARPISLAPWRGVDSSFGKTKSFVGVAFISHDDLRRVSISPLVRFDVGFPNALRDLSASTTLSTEGLRNGVGLLARVR